MPTFSTPGPVDVALDVQVGEIVVVATERVDTIVTVRPTNPAKESDRRGAEATRVEHAGGRITVTGPKARVLGPAESIDVTVELPASSRLTAELAVGTIRSTGLLGNTRTKTAAGSVELEDTGDLSVRSSHGNVTVGRIDGVADVTTDSGRIRVGAITGGGVVGSSQGSVTIGESAGALQAKLSAGDIEVHRSMGPISARTAMGSITLGEVSTGSVEAESSLGQIEVGVLSGVAAWLDLSSKLGHVRNELDGAEAPAASEQSVTIRARTKAGDIRVRRAPRL